jgi:hypothetical protein
MGCRAAGSNGSTSAISNHCWGSAIDLTIDDILDNRGHNLTRLGLMQNYRHCNRHGFS